MSVPDSQARPFFTALRDRWWIVALCTFTAAILTFLAVHRQPGQFEATATFGLHNQNIDRDIFQLSPKIDTIQNVLYEQPGNLDTQAAAVKATELVGLQPATAGRTILADTSVDLDTKFYLPDAHGRANTAAGAQHLANAFAQAIVDIRAASDKRRITAAMQSTQKTLTQTIKQLVVARKSEPLKKPDLEASMQRQVARLVRLQLMLKFRPPTVYVVRWAPLPTSRTRPPAKLMALYAAIFGLMMGCSLLAWRENRDRRPRAGEIIQELHAAILTDLPRSALLPGSRPHGPKAGELKALDAVRRVLEADRPHSVVAVTEAVTIGRASAVARLLAETAALSGSRTLFATNDPYATAATIPGMVMERYPIEIGEAAGNWLAERRDDYDLIVFDLPSPVGSGAALELASRADRVLAVWLPDSVHRRQLSRMGRTLAMADIRLAGVVRVGGQAA